MASLTTSKRVYWSPAGYPPRAVFVKEGEEERTLDPRNDLFNHSPDGFASGYGGSGPAQLALAILADATGDDRLAVKLHQGFKWEVIAKLPETELWLLTRADVLNWIRDETGADKVLGLIREVQSDETDDEVDDDWYY